MNCTRITHHLNAPRASVYRAFLDPDAVARWMVPPDMRCQVHAFEAREGGTFRISLTYESDTGTGKSSAHTDTYHGRFVSLRTDEQIVEVLEFESPDPAMQGEMTLVITLSDHAGGTELTVVHDRLPPGLKPSDNELGWRLSLAQLTALVES